MNESAVTEETRAERNAALEDRYQAWKAERATKAAAAKTHSDTALNASRLESRVKTFDNALTRERNAAGHKARNEAAVKAREIEAIRDRANYVGKTLQPKLVARDNANALQKGLTNIRARKAATAAAAAAAVRAEAGRGTATTPAGEARAQTFFQRLSATVATPPSTPARAGGAAGDAGTPGPAAGSGTAAARAAAATPEQAATAAAVVQTLRISPGAEAEKVGDIAINFARKYHNATPSMVSRAIRDGYTVDKNGSFHLRGGFVSAPDYWTTTLDLSSGEVAGGAGSPGSSATSRGPKK